MAGSSDIRAGRAFVETYVNNSALVKGLADASRRLKDFGNGIATVGKWMMGIGSAIVAPLVAATKHFMDAGDQLDKMAARTGISTNALSELGYAAETSGSNIEEVEKGVRKLEKAIALAGEGEKTYADALSRVGQSYERLKDLSPEDQFMAIMDGLGRIQDPGKRAAAAMELFGKSGTSLLPMIGDVRALRDEAKQLGLSIGPEQAKAAAEMDDAWTRVKRSVGAVFFEIGASVSRAGILDGIAAIIGSAQKWVESNREVVVTVAKVAGGLVAGGAATIVFGKALSVAGGAMGFFGSGLKVGMAGVKAITSLVAAFATPLGIATLAVGALGGAILYLAKDTAPVQAIMGAFGSLGEYVSGVVSTVASDFGAAWRGIVDSVMAGNLSGAMEIVGATLRLEWLRVTTWLTEQWEGFKTWFYNGHPDMAKGIINAWAAIQKFIGGVIGSIKSMWNDAVNSIAKGLVALGQKYPAIGKAMGMQSGQELRDQAIRNAEGNVNFLKSDTFKQDASRRGISQEQQAAALKRAEDQLAAARATTAEQYAAGIAADMNGTLSAAHDATSAAIDDASRKAEKAIEELRAARTADVDSGNAGAKDRIAAAQAELDAAIKARDAAVAAAGENRKKAEAERVAQRAGKPGMPNLDDVNLSAAKASASVTFSASALGSMGMSGIQERIARGVEKTFQFIGEQTSVTKDMRDQVKKLTLEAAP